MSVAEEIWKTITEAASYQVSNLGKVRNVHTGRVLKFNMSTGTPSVVLREGGQALRRSVPKLVNLAFDPSEAGESWQTCKDAYMYSVSNLGRVRNNSTGRVLKTLVQGKGGVATVTLRDAGWQIRRSVSQLVKEAFG